MFVATRDADRLLDRLTVQKGIHGRPRETIWITQLGFAWSPGVFHDKVVTSGGYGLSYNRRRSRSPPIS